MCTRVTESNSTIPASVTFVSAGILAGLVSITAGCAVVEPYAAVIIGIIGGAMYYCASWGLLKLQIDDPLDASPVHFFSGMWGLLAVGFFATPANIRNVYGGRSPTVMPTFSFFSSLLDFSFDFQ